MIGFTLTEEQAMFRQAMVEFAAGEITPVARECDERGEYPVNLFTQMGALGYLGIPFPTEYGGRGGGTLTAAIFGSLRPRRDSVCRLCASAWPAREMGATHFLRRMVGPTKAVELLLTGPFIDAEEAERIGLVTHAVAPEQLDAVTAEYAAALARPLPSRWPNARWREVWVATSSGWLILGNGETKGRSPGAVASTASDGRFIGQPGRRAVNCEMLSRAPFIGATLAARR